DLDGWPRSDANTILFTEIVLMALFLKMNACDTLLQSRGFGHYGEHLTGIFVFLNYLPYSKHLHIILAFPNAYYARLEPQGKMRNMPEIQKEVLYAMQPETAPTGDAVQEPVKKFGAKDVFDLSWKNL